MHTTINLKFEHGSALVESTLILGVLGIFMGGIPMLGSLIDLKQTTIQASRYSAWEKTVEVDLGHLGDKVEQRFFGDESLNLLWGEGNQHNNGSVTIDGVNVELTSGSTVNSDASLYSTFSNTITKFGRAVGSGGWEEGSPIANGLVTSTVHSAVKPNEYFTERKQISESTAIFIDGWSAGEDTEIRERVQGFMPTNKLEKLGAFVSKLRFLPMFGDLKNLKNAFGCVKTNIVTPKEYAPVGDDALLTRYMENPGDQC